MKIDLQKIKVSALVEDYKDSGEKGVKGFGGLLDIRPPYQREFVYALPQQKAVINSVMRGLPLNVMYWVVNSNDDFEVMDGQQRTISLCRYINNEFSVDDRYFHSLTDTEQAQIMDYELMIYFCEGNDKDKLEWFRTINMAGEKLTDQELRNAVYTGSWLVDAKPKFSKNNCAASLHGDHYVKGSPIRQELLEMALGWVSDGNIEEYMSAHQHDANADELWNHYRKVINWAKAVFPVKRKELASVNWGKLYKLYGDKHFDADELEAEIQKLFLDDDVTKNSGVYMYLLTGEEKHLSIRAFLPKMKTAAYTRQKGICAHCGDHFELSEMEADHITPWAKGGATTAENCQMLCMKCNRTKSGK
ncbi:DUF262 domain-containing protein [Salmonella enterica]|nr:DUF262 domain-containing protein [Salmonella enterica subsp. enterica serovar Saintpaul]EEC1303356.1 DUF262 domain-containing protein [Salmonella enterica]